MSTSEGEAIQAGKSCFVLRVRLVILVSGMNAIEAIGTVDAQHQLRLDQPLPFPEQSRVRVIVLLPETELGEPDWLTAATKNPAFGFLKEESEDIYTRADGKPFHDQR